MYSLEGCSLESPMKGSIPFIGLDVVIFGRRQGCFRITVHTSILGVLKKYCIGYELEGTSGVAPFGALLPNALQPLLHNRKGWRSASTSPLARFDVSVATKP